MSKTAKEIAKSCKAGEGKFLNAQYMFSEDEFNKFCKQLCEEQRRKCVTEWYYSDGILDDRLLIENAPEPKLD